MARRKANKGFLSDGDSSDSSGGGGDDDFDSSFLPGDDDADAREERAMFDDPYSRKRKRGDGRDAKEEALYGIFAEDQVDEDAGFGGKARGGGGGKAGGKRADWSK